MKYYGGHEGLYQKLKEANKSSWDERNGDSSGFDDFCMRRFLEEALARLTFPAAPPRALEIGCGTGPVCCFLATKGFDVSGIDVSPTAIGMARQKASERNLRLRFEVQDICALPMQEAGYDLIVDGHCLHCLVRDADRHKALSTVRTLLQPEGVFLVSTMIYHEEIAFATAFPYDKRSGILWVGVDERTQFEDAENRDGRWYIPQRRILPADALVKEMKAHGFSFLWERVTEPEQAGSPALFEACLQQRDVLASSEGKPALGGCNE